MKYEKFDVCTENSSDEKFYICEENNENCSVACGKNICAMFDEEKVSFIIIDDIFFH